MRRAALTVALAVATLIPTAALADGGADDAPLAPLIGQTDERAIPDRFIVVMHDGSTTTVDAVIDAVPELRSDPDGRVSHRFEHSIRGFAARLSQEALTELRAHPDVAFIEADKTVSISATWGQDRIDQRDLPLDGAYSPVGNGSGVHAYVIDTGIRASHNEFTGRTGNGFDAIGGGTDDCNGHGTHVAGTIGGTTYGVAPQVTLHAVRVLDCGGTGSTSGVIAGVDWVAANHVSPAVANMSLGGPRSTSLDAAVSDAVDAGVTVVVAAGNETTDACNGSPARESSAITVGATTSNDSRAWFSNYGTCLDIFGPGDAILSAWINSNSSTAVLSGTSMASPHVAGGAALLLGANPTASPADVVGTLTGAATVGVVSDARTGSPNLLLFVGDDGTVPPPPPPPPPPPGGDATAHVGDLDGSTSVVRGARYSLTVTVGIHDDADGALAGVTVEGTFVNGSSASCVTGSDGTCSVSTDRLSNRRYPEASFTVDAVTGTDISYDPGANHDPDGDSDGTIISVIAP